MASHTFHDCCNAVVRAAENRDGLIQYAAAYAKTGLAILPDAMPGEATDATRTQALYILSNLQGWRGEQARAVKRSLKEIAR